MTEAHKTSGTWTTGQVAERLGYSTEKIRQMCEQGAFPAARRDGYGGHWRIPRADIDSYLASVRPRVRVKQ